MSGGTATAGRDANGDLRPFIPIGRYFDFATVPYFWNINGVTDLGASVEVEGWALPFAGRDGGTAIWINGTERGEATGGELDEVARLYPWWPNARRSQFRIRVRKAEFDLLSEPELEFRAVPRPPAAADPQPYRSLYLRPGDLGDALPEPEMLARIGCDNRFHYALFGRTLYRQFENALAGAAGLTFADRRFVIDWGCSSGRVARHVVGALGPGQQLAGFDIDAAAVRWAQQRIGPYFALCDRLPPLDVPPQTADLVYSYSVFTHLPRDVQRLWIDEFARVLIPGGYFLFTILSDTAVLGLSPYPSAEFIDLLLASGIHDGSENTQLQPIDVGGDYYRNVWMTAEYVAQNWGERFEILAIERNFHFYQDLVICRRRPG